MTAATTMRNPELDVQITGMRLEAAGVISLELQTPDRSPLPAWTAGSHVDLVLPSGLTRQYSLCGDIDDTLRLRIAVLLVPTGRGGSREVHSGLRLGQTVTIRGPRNAFELQPADSFLFVAGGIGITPILPMIRAVQKANAKWHLMYGGRSRASMAFIPELQRTGGGNVEILPADEVGLLDLDSVVARAAAGAQVYSCGPGALLDALTARFAAADLSDSLHIERFGAAPVASGTTDSKAGSLRVILARSGATVDVPSDCSVMSALRDAGHCVPSSCEQGICGMCETRVLDGVPDHRDSLLTESERERSDTMMVCVSRARSPTITLDL
ncbi:PDR/VanB family oxidoreductase [Paraburkholderia sp.]|uniref:PDR/VanB family oxidoreductase n=1 Tax=Paraburkholderia sp. TaxID=1926495 RepID=UPI002D3B9375|nr:PDR/VanB family oxidoreductase [Paraburkholderia sp.]HZZ05001.1 PDR/VanB family oxidoreductase [Paraburkholderia sp.]